MLKRNGALCLSSVKLLDIFFLTWTVGILGNIYFFVQSEKINKI